MDEEGKTKIRIRKKKKVKKTQKKPAAYEPIHLLEEIEEEDNDLPAQQNEDQNLFIEEQED